MPSSSIWLAPNSNLQNKRRRTREFKNAASEKLFFAKQTPGARVAGEFADEKLLFAKQMARSPKVAEAGGEKLLFTKQMDRSREEAPVLER